MSALAQAALEYAARGFHIFPCRPRDKQPLIENWPLKATTDPTQVAEWWTTWPEANIGCVPGLSGCVVIDVDGPEGEALAASLDLPATRESKTGRGRHLWYQHPGGHVGNGHDLGKGIDLRGNAGYVLIAPSVHPNGRKYQWIDESIDFVALPPALVSRLATKSAESRADVPQEELRGELNEVTRWVSLIPNDRGDFDNRVDWFKIGCAIKAALPDDPIEARELFEKWSEQWNGHRDPAKEAHDWRTMHGPHRVGAPFLRELARRYHPELLAEMFVPSDALPAAALSVSPTRIEEEEIPLLLWNDLGNVPEASWMVDQVFQRDSITSLWGASRAFKSFLAIHLGLHVATGAPWSGRTAQQGSVVYLVGEGVTGFHKRAYAAADALGIVDLRNAAFACVPRAYDLTDPKLVGRLCARLAPLHPSLIVVDTYFRYAPGRDHNKQVDHSVFMAGLDRLRMAFGATVLVLDHGTKDPEDHRGPGGTVHKFAGYDTILMLEREGNSFASTLTMQKQKDAEELAPLTLSMVRHDKSLVVESAGVIWAEEASNQSAEIGLRGSEDAALLALDRIALDDGEAISWKRWYEDTELSERTFGRARKRLVERRLVEKVGEKYRVTPLGREHLRQSRPDPGAVMGLNAEEEAAVNALLYGPDGVSA